MEGWAIAFALVAASVLISRAVDRYTKSRKELESTWRMEYEKLARRNAISNIVGVLVAGALSNQTYIDTIEQLDSERIDAILSEAKEDKEQRIREAESVLDDYSVFHYRGREKFLDLAWSIFDKVAKQTEERAI